MSDFSSIQIVMECYSAFGSGAKQPFGNADRMLAPVSFQDSSNSPALDRFGFLIDDLKNALSGVMGRVSMRDNSLAHEAYFSLSLPSASLKRHLDEKHEELRLKGRSDDSRSIDCQPPRLVNVLSEKHLLAALPVRR